MLWKRKFLRFLLLLLAFWSATAQTTSRQAALNAIIARANDKVHPQSAVLTDKQLRDWAAKYKENLQERIVASPPTAGKPDAAKVCPADFEAGGGKCHLIVAEMRDGKMHCYYDCR